VGGYFGDTVGVCETGIPKLVELVRVGIAELWSGLMDTSGDAIPILIPRYIACVSIWER